MFAAFAPTATADGRRCCPSFEALKNAPSVHPMLELVSSDKVLPGYVAWSLPPVLVPGALTWDTIESPMAAFVIQSEAISAPDEPGWEASTIWDHWSEEVAAAVAAGGNGNVQRCPYFQADNVLPANYIGELPPRIRLPRSANYWLLVSRAEHIMSILAVDRVCAMAEGIRAALVACRAPTLNANDFDQSLLRYGRGGPGSSGAAAMPVHQIKSVEQKKRDKQMGVAKDVNPVEAARQKKEQGVHYLARLTHFEYSFLKELLGDALDLKAPNVITSIRNLFANVSDLSGLAIMSSHTVLFMLTGNYGMALTSLSANSSIDGNFGCENIQLYGPKITPHPDDPRGPERKFLVDTFKSCEKIRKAVEKMIAVKCLVTTRHRRGGSNQFLCECFRLFLEQIWNDDSDGAWKECSVDQMFELVTIRLLRFNEVINKKTLEGQPVDTPQECYEKCVAALDMPNDVIIAAGHRAPKESLQFSNLWRPDAHKNKPVSPPVNAAAGKKAAPVQGGGAQKKKAAVNPFTGAPVVANPVAGGGGGGAVGGGVPRNMQFCVNAWAGMAMDPNLGCNKPGCDRIHSFSPPAAGAKWPVAVLDGVADGANRIKNNNAFKQRVLSKIQSLR
jgi:hypothetical protein